MIRDRGYFHWDGAFIERRWPWWPITRQGLRLAFKMKLFKFIFVGSLVPAFVFLAGVYISERLEDFKAMVHGRGVLFSVDPAFFKTYYSIDFLLLMLVMLMLFSGAGLIADDAKHNALQLYFSRPIKKKDYFLGKAGVLWFFLLILTLVPGLLFILFKIIFSGSFALLRSFPWLPLSVLAESLILTVFFSLYTLLLSSLSSNRRYVSIMIFGVYIFSDILFGIFYGLVRSPYAALLSIKANLQQVAAFLFRLKPAFAVSWVYSLLILGAICVLSLFVLNRRIKGVTVIR
jgi:ABC-type transport system involved in multi-copper enzyme maturation permease subunit